MKILCEVDNQKQAQYYNDAYQSLYNTLGEDGMRKLNKFGKLHPNIEGLFRDSVNRFGRDIKKNPFAKVLTSAKSVPFNSDNETVKSNINILYTNIANSNISPLKTDVDSTSKKYWWDNSELFTRKSKDFQYLIKILDSVYVTENRRKYFDKPENIDTSELYNGSVLKPSGIDKRDDPNIDTVYNTIERWSNGVEKRQSTRVSSDVEKQAKKILAKLSNKEELTNDEIVSLKNYIKLLQDVED